MGFKFPIPIPLSPQALGVILVLIGIIWIATQPKQYSPINVKIGEDGKPGNPTGQQGIDYRNLQEQTPWQQLPGANIIQTGESWT